MLVFAWGSWIFGLNLAWHWQVVCGHMHLRRPSEIVCLGVVGNLSDIWVLLLGIYILEPVVLPTMCPSEFLEGGINDSSVYMQCCR